MVVKDRVGRQAFIYLHRPIGLDLILKNVEVFEKKWTYGGEEWGGSGIDKKDRTGKTSSF